MALLVRDFLRTVVSIEVDNGAAEPATIATGFLCAKVEKKEVLEDGKEKKIGRVYLVTAKHVFWNIKNNSIKREKIFLRFDQKDGKEQIAFPVNLVRPDGRPIFMVHPKSSVDVAVLGLNTKLIKELGVEFRHFLSDKDMPLTSDYESLGISVGDNVYVLGFPRGFRGTAQNSPICRQGIIARLDAEGLSNNYFIIDAPVFKGNSGGPVLNRPEIAALSDTKPVESQYLIGLVSKYLKAGRTIEEIETEDEIEISDDLKPGHIGLAKVETVDSILEAIAEAEKVRELTE